MINTTLYVAEMQQNKLQFCNMLKHRGEILKQVIKDLNAKVSHVADKMKIDRGTVYRHMEDPELSFDHIIKYGEALNFDFSKHFPEMIYVLKEPPSEYGSAKSYDELKDAAEYWKDKYIDILEKYNALLVKYGSGGDNSNKSLSNHGS